MNLHFIEQFYSDYGISESTQAVISLFIIFLVSFLITRLTKKVKLPNVTAYILAGILIGPYVLNLVPYDPSVKNSFSSVAISMITDTGLAFIAFSSGRYFNLRMIKQNGAKPLIIAVVQSVLTSICVYLCLMPFKLPVAVTLILASIAGTTSSASTLMTIREFRCEGEFVNYTIELTAIDNVLGILSFSVCSGVALGMLNAGNGGSIDAFQTIWLPLLVNLGMMIIGFLLGLFMAKVVISPTRSKDNRLILMVAAILVLVGLCGLVNVLGKNIPITCLLSVMIMAASYRNFSNDDEMFRQVSDFSAPVILLFFVMSGLKFQLSYLATVGVIGVVYFLVRMVFKYGSNFLGGVITKSEKSITRYIGLIMQPQAGISIGLAALALNIFTGTNAEYGDQINAIIIFAGILYEMVGPALARLALKLSGTLAEENRTNVRGMALKTYVTTTESTLRDFVEVKPTTQIIQRVNDLNNMKSKMDEAERYIHTKEYTGQDYSS